MIYVAPGTSYYLTPEQAAQYFPSWMLNGGEPPLVVDGPPAAAATAGADPEKEYFAHRGLPGAYKR